MANHKSALKRARQNEKRRTRNRQRRAALRTLVRQFRETTEAGGDTATLLPTVMSEVQSAAAKGYLPRKRASRLIARLSRAANG